MSLFVVGAGSARLVVGAVDPSAFRTCYANEGSADDAPLRLGCHRPTRGGLRLSVLRGDRP